ncbi:MAG TPA: prepilin-type N-terminal cleavage/methylation domain-containing protein [Thermoanaerobaculia bacterium]|nr:prepilin-type N-terminal cleavage/methylation domain-containing protein [Thermoanaerobaculia bacterium]
MSECQRGFTLLEAAVTVLIVAVCLALAAVILADAQPLFAGAGRRLTDPLTGRVAEGLRTDLQGAAFVLVTPAGEQGDPLCLARPGNEEVVCWRQDGERLLREVWRDGDRVAEAVWLQRLVLWQWFEPVPGLVRVEVRFARAPDPRPRRTAARTAVATESLVVALRGGGRVGSW